MANSEHLRILQQGVDAWNRWRSQNASVTPDLRGADLFGALLRGIHLHNTLLSGTNLNKAHLTGAHLYGAYLSGAYLRGTRLRNADLRAANLSAADLRGANLHSASLIGADLHRAQLAGANLSEVSMGNTRLNSVDLGGVHGLESVQHFGPSSIDIDTIYKSKGVIPAAFLHGCGIPESFIVYIRTLVAGVDPIQFYSCFVSYSSKDQEFAERIYTDLQSNAVRCWFAPEDLKIGDRFRVRIDESIRLYDKLLLVLSENSVASQWVEKEVETAFEREKQEGKMVLFPVRLDDSAMKVKTGWAADVRRTRHIGDFTDWKSYDSYKRAFDRLIRDLRAEG